MFKKGHVKMGGRKKGTPNKKVLKKVAEVLAEQDLNPAEKIVSLLIHGDLEDKDRIRAWASLLEWCEAKPKARVDEPADEPNAEEFENVSSEDLLKIVQDNEGA